MKLTLFWGGGIQGELVIVTSKTAKDISPEEAFDYILGYTLGNDLTARMYQDPKRSAGQFTYSKAYDKFAPLGPRLVSPKVYAAQVRDIETRVNGKTFQKSKIDLIFDPPYLVSFLSQGTSVAYPDLSPLLCLIKLTLRQVELCLLVPL